MPRKKISELTAVTTPDLDAVIPIVQSATATNKYKPAFPLNVRAFGASPSATAAVNTTAFMAAIAAADAAGGGVVVVPRGTHLVSGASGSPVIDIGSASNITLQGEGPDATIIKLADGADGHVLNIDGATNIVIRDLTIDGNRANQTLSVHGIRGGTNGVTGLWIERCTIKECAHYGIGLGAGTKSHVYLSDLKILNTGGDGIDIKNNADTSDLCVANNITIENFGLNDAGTAGQAGFDARGPWQLSNITVKWTIADGRGIRFRSGEAIDANGYGGHDGHLVNFECAGPGGTSKGVEIDARDVKIANGKISGAHRGIATTAARTCVTNVTVSESVDASFHADTGGDDMTIADCSALDGTSRGIRISAARCSVRGGQVTGNTSFGIDLSAAASDARIEDVYIASNGAAITDLGTRTRIGTNNIGLGGLVASSISESVADDATSANLDVALNAGTSYTFRVHADSEDANGNRCTVRGLLRALRSGSGAPVVSPLTIELAEGAGEGGVSWLLITPSASGNNLRVSVRNDMGADCHMTIRVWELDRAATVEDS